MQTMTKVSVIIPVYGVEKYIARCAHSLFSQTMREGIEFIFIDDCTPDRSIDILCEVLEQYPYRKAQTRIVKMPTNSGLPAVRQHGIQLAKGDYIIHCDSDDWVDIRMYEAMYRKAMEENADIVICDYNTVSEDNQTKTYVGAMHTKVEKFIADMLSTKVSWSVWNKLVKKELYSDIIYPLYAMGEDLLFTMQVCLKAHHIAYEDKAFYFYFKNNESITKVKSPLKVLDRYEQYMNNLKVLFGILSGNSKHLLGKDNGILLKMLAKDLILPLVTLDDKYYRMWLNSFPEINYAILLYPHITLRKKVKHLLTMLRIPN